jgi:hypothetical protein
MSPLRQAGPFDALILVTASSISRVSSCLNLLIEWPGAPALNFTPAMESVYVMPAIGAAGLGIHAVLPADT